MFPFIPVLSSLISPKDTLQESRALYTSDGDAALSSKDYDKAIELYSAAIDLDSSSDTIFGSRCTAKLGKLLWDDALLDAQKVRWCLFKLYRKPSSMPLLGRRNKPVILSWI
jgi:tetratricopeptide (TPR) repeat protein